MAEGQIIVTGASKGIGAAIARELDARGFGVASLSRTGTSPVGVSFACDMTDDDAIKRVIEDIVRRGPILGLVNNAGVHVAEPITSLSSKSFNNTIALNATAVIVASREAFPYLRETHGTIVNIGSFFDKLGVPDNLAYCASKAAVAAITRCMAVEWARHDIRIINVAPGYIETDLNKDYLAKEKVRDWLGRRIPVGGPGAAGEVARLVAAIFSERIRFLTGETIYVDGAQGINH
jgi:NAD(P)-dependent dehydrogenase (short-subunit alcohol dehydrogenase family)